jgi:hypothetical protein
VIATGAPAYDHWFSMRASTSRLEFCSKVGLRPDQPYLLYLCSSPFIAPPPHEVNAVRQWIAAVRRSPSETLRSAGILVRPHPQNADQWLDVDLSGFGNAAIWPRRGANPIADGARSEYFDSMYHAHAVAGVNTSALIESGIVGRVVYSVRVPELAATQEGTLHFRHLVRGGLLRLADTLEEHAAQLSRSFDAADQDRDRVRDFIRMFIRPDGLDQPATPRAVQAIEHQAAIRPAPQSIPPYLRPVRLALQAAGALPRAAR